MRPGDSVLILCEVIDADEHSYTMAVNAVIYRHDEAVINITECDMLIHTGKG